MSAYERVLERLRERGMAWGYRSRYFRCPAHEDRSPSLSLAEGEDRVLIYCFAGCSVREIVAALDLTMDDLFEEGVEREPQRDPRPQSPWGRYEPPPPPPGYVVIDGERVWTDWRDVQTVPEPPAYQPGPLLKTVATQYPSVAWLLVEERREREWICAEPHLNWLRQRFPEVPEWAWTVLRTAA